MPDLQPRTNRAPYCLYGEHYWRSDVPICMTREREFFSLPLHMHDFVEISYVAEGRGFHYIGDERLEVGRGDLFLIPVGTAHVYRPVSPNPDHELIVYNCLFAPELFDRLKLTYPLPFAADELIAGSSGSYRAFKDTHHDMRGAMEHLYAEHMLREPGSEAAMLAQLVCLLLALHRNERCPGAAPASISRLAEVFAYLAEHYNEPVTLQRLADMVPVSVSHLQRLFKQTKGQSFTEYLQNVRIAKSCELLAQTPDSVRDVAARVGYRDLTFFHALFKKKTGLSPSQYRKHAHAHVRQLSEINQRV